MKIIPIYNFKLIPPGYSAITLYPFVLFRSKKEDVSYITLKHEMTHVDQIRVHGWLSFYLSYLLYFLAGLLRFKSWNAAYYDIPWERMAVSHQLTPLMQSEADELGVE